MQIIKDKDYDNISQETLKFVSYNSNGTLSFVMTDGAHYNFNSDELKKIVKFVKKIEGGEAL